MKRPTRSRSVEGEAKTLTATLAKALDALEAVAAAEQDVTLTELAQRVGFPPATAFRILSTFRARGYVEKDRQTGRYRLGLKACEVAAAAVRRLEIRDVARPRMQALVNEVDETAYVSVLEGNGVIIIEKVDSSRPVKVDTYLGLRAPAHCAATGKAILAFAARAITERLFAQPLARSTRRTICSRTRLEEELARTRHNGYAVNREEWREGVCGVAVPIRSQGGEPLAALGIALPVDRFSEQRLQEELVPALVRAGGAISRDLARGAP